MSEHLSPQQIEEWLIGQRTPQAEEHLRLCRVCAGKVESAAQPLRLFGSAMRSWSDEVMPSRERVPVGDRARGMRRWRLALAVAAILLMIAVPVYRHESVIKQQAAAALAARRRGEDEMLLRQVEAGLSRSVPAPMEPLAKLMPSDLGR